MKAATVVDLFCGVGGLTHGFALEGFNVVAGIDSDESCRYAYEHNNHAQFINARVEQISAADIAELYPKGHIKILVGCAPCQPFSKYAQSRKSPDDKWRLLTAFADLIDEIHPDIVSMENVPNLKTFRGGATYRAFVDRLRSTYGDNVTDFIANCPEYGIPQQRKRLVLFASRFGVIKLEEAAYKGRHRTVREVIGDLPPIEAGGVCPTDPLHKSSMLSELNLRRIRQSRPGGTWRDWDPDLVAGCHMKDTGESYSSVYGRMKWSEPSPTITTQCHGYGNGRFGHPEQDRAISLREAALLQTFPAEYQFVAPGEPVRFATVGRYIGNAVPVDLGCVIARSIKKHVEEQDISSAEPEASKAVSRRTPASKGCSFKIGSSRLGYHDQQRAQQRPGSSE